MSENNFSRRKFLAGAAAIGAAGAMGVGTFHRAHRVAVSRCRCQLVLRLETQRFKFTSAFGYCSGRPGIKSRCYWLWWTWFRCCNELSGCRPGLIYYCFGRCISGSFRQFKEEN